VLVSDRKTCLTRVSGPGCTPRSAPRSSLARHTATLAARSSAAARERRYCRHAALLCRRAGGRLAGLRATQRLVKLLRVGARLRVHALLRRPRPALSAHPSPPRPAGGAGPCWAQGGRRGPDWARDDRGAGAAVGAAGPALEAHRRDRDVCFAMGDEVLLGTEHAPLSSRSLFSPRWMGPFKVLACPAPNTYRLDVPATWRVIPKFKVEHLRPYLRGSACRYPPTQASIT
jgi:hypothetical protein